MIPVASCIPFPFFALGDDMLAMLLCATCWFYMHLYTLAYMSMHESCLLVCRPCFNTMKVWTSDLDLHLSLADTTFVCFLACLPSRLFACFLVSLLAMSIMFIYFMPLSYALHISFFPLLFCWFLVFIFACTHIKRGCMELGHDLPSASKKGKNASMWI